MKILVLTDDNISHSHGTGAVLLKIMGNHPSEFLAHGYLNKVSATVMENSFHISVSDTSDNLSQTASAIFQHLDKTGFHPDLIYSNFYGVAGLRVLHAIIENSATLPPVIQHFHDLRIDSKNELFCLLARIQSRIARLWVLTHRMAQQLKESHIHKPIEIFNSFSSPEIPHPKQIHYPFTPRFKAVMLGNVWMPQVMPTLRMTWRALCNTMPGLGPIQWYSHPFSVENLKRNGQETGFEIKHLGFAPVLSEVLPKADIAVVPFNLKDPPENDYAKCSLPSRLAELTMAGLPIFAIASPGTSVRDFIIQNGIGTCACPSDGNSALYKSLSDLAADQERRKEFGEKARSLALAEYDMKRIRKKYFDAFTQTLSESKGKRI